jgi:uncharacterized protein with von Willebrand factor type A (vWA) domain
MNDPLPPDSAAEDGRLAENVLYFARTLRAAGASAVDVLTLARVVRETV